MVLNTFASHGRVRTGAVTAAVVVAVVVAGAVPALAAGTSFTPRTVVVAAVPGPPATVVAVPGSNQVTVRWTAPTTGDPAVDYLVQKSVDGGATWSTVVGSPVAAPGTSLVATRLANRKPIVFRVAARNASGTGPWVLSRTVVPREISPKKPSAIAGRSLKAGTITLTWRPPASGPAPTRYEYRYRKGFGTFVAWRPLPVTARTVTFGGLQRNADYLCQVRGVRVTDVGDTATVWVRTR